MYQIHVYDVVIVPHSKNSSPEPEKEDKPEKTSGLIEEIAEKNHAKKPVSDHHPVEPPSATVTSTIGENSNHLLVRERRFERPIIQIFFSKLEKMKIN